LSVQHNRTRAAAGVIVLSLFFAVFLLPQTQAVDQTGQDLNSKISFLTSTFNAANTSLTKTLKDLENKGVTIPQAGMSAFQEAQVLFSQSAIANGQGEVTQAITLTIQALGKIKETITNLNGTIAETTSAQEVANQQALQLRGEIDRANATLHNFEAMAARAADKGVNTTVVNQEIKTAKANLESAASNLNRGSTSQAQEKISEAQVLIDRLTDFFNSYALTLKSERVTQYLNAAEQNLESLEQQYSSVSSQLSSTTQAAASAAITKAQNSLETAKQYLSNQQVSQTIDALNTVKSSVEAITTYVNAASPTPAPTPVVTATPASNVASTAKSTNRP
jgi:predicted  nucleic acid-binding Zn-ribbon protein